MYLSIGNDMAVRDVSIIGIFDMDNTTTSKRTRELLKKRRRREVWYPAMICLNPMSSQRNTV